FMMQAKVGDDVLGDDPTVQELESMMANMFGKDDAIFCPSGTMTNQIAVKAHTQPGEEIICDETSHVYKFEAGGIGFNSGCSVRLVQGDQGRMKPKQILENINPDNVHYPQTKLVIAENTSNMGGGSIYNYNDLSGISEICQKNGLKFHLDGARLYNALVETGETPNDYGKIFDSVSICFSKGLGAPIGSVLIGNHDFIIKARRIRKVFGGGMRQSGYLAAAAIFAMNNNISRLKEDHRRAKELSDFLATMNYVKEVMPTPTNIVNVTLNHKYSQAELLGLLNEKGLWAFGFGPDKIRFVTHMDFTDEMLYGAQKIFKELS
ncbi:MAG: aminotransferase class I/II-fold pyridoxal phosphate-dependent enzyme, partial [Bacteroidales bacterium]|nr:aminotransferase class I/II-fold pyridoxal phosphate-dependent enzyme [Bacteroidales bacterium]